MGWQMATIEKLINRSKLYSKMATITEPLSVKVTRINEIYHARLYRNGQVFDEAACRDRRDIGFIIHWMLRMYDKCVGDSPMADAARHRKWNLVPVGRIWYSSMLPVTLRKKRNLR